MCSMFFFMEKLVVAPATERKRLLAVGEAVTRFVASLRALRVASARAASAHELTVARDGLFPPAARLEAFQARWPGAATAAPGKLGCTCACSDGASFDGADGMLCFVGDAFDAGGLGAAVVVLSDFQSFQ